MDQLTGSSGLLGLVDELLEGSARYEFRLLRAGNADRFARGGIAAGARRTVDGLEGAEADQRYGFTAAHGRNDFFEGAHDNAVNLGFRGRIAGGDAVYEFKTVHKNPCVKAMFLYCSA